MKTNKFILVGLTFMFVVNARSQEFNPLSLSMYYLHNTQANKPLAMNGNISFNMPVYSDSMFSSLTGVSLKYFNVNLPDDSLGIHNLYSFSLPFTEIFRTPSGNLITFVFEPIIASDFEDLSYKNLRFNTAAFYKLSNRKKSAWGLGLAVSKRFSGFLIMPVAFFNIRLSDKLILSGSFPLKQKLSYVFDDNKQIGVSLGAGNNSFRLSKANESRYINSQQFGVNCFYQQIIAKHLGMEISLGLLSSRTFVYNHNQKETVTIFPFNYNRTKNAIESIKTKGLQFQISFFYSLSESKRFLK